MNAVRIHQYGGPEVLVYEEVERPSPGPRQALVRVQAASVNPADAAVRENRFPTPKQPPKIIGSDGAGVVEEVGDEVTGVRPGDEVFFTGLGIGSEGSYAEYAVIADVQAVPKPAQLSWAEAAAMGLTYATAMNGLVRRGGLQPGETVVVQGAAGGVGSAAVQLAKARGGRVIGVVGSTGDAEVARGLGADETVIYRTEDVVARVRELTDGRGADLVLELVTSVNLATDVALIATGGRIVCIGQGPDPEVAVPIAAALASDATLLFSSTNNAKRAGIAEMLREVAAMAADGALKPVVGATFPLAQARAAHEALAGAHVGKIVLIP